VPLQSFGYLASDIAASKGVNHQVPRIGQELDKELWEAVGKSCRIGFYAVLSTSLEILAIGIGVGQAQQVGRGDYDVRSQRSPSYLISPFRFSACCALRT